MSRLAFDDLSNWAAGHITGPKEGFEVQPSGNINIGFGSWILVKKPGVVIDIKNPLPARDVYELHPLTEEGFLLEPNTGALVYTVNHFRFTGSQFGLVNGRSSGARVHLGVHVNAPFIWPGHEGQIVFELYYIGTGGGVMLYPARPDVDARFASLTVHQDAGARQAYDSCGQYPNGAVDLEQDPWAMASKFTKG